MSSTPTLTPKQILPEGVKLSDLKRTPTKYGTGKNKYRVMNEEEQPDYALGEHGRLLMHYVTGRGWVIATLHISRSRTAADRTYGIEIGSGGIVTVGNGPHIVETIEVLLKRNRVPALQKYLDLYNKGMVDANTIRDRISTRRANTVMRRGSGFGLGLFGGGW